MKLIHMYDLYKTQINLSLQTGHNIALAVITALLRRRFGSVRGGYAVEKSGNWTGLFTGTPVSPGQNFGPE